ncbi:MAG: DUF309 domain-containing protein [Chloroflexota bacterium]
MSKSPRLITFFSNEEAVSRIKETAVSQNLTLINVADETAVGPIRLVSQQETLGETLSGQTGKLFELITTEQPVLLIFDLDNTAVPWQRWIPALKSSPATHRFPILGVSHIDESLNEAQRVGANYSANKDEFEQTKATLIKNYARIPNYDSLKSTCDDPLSELALEGITLFNQGEFYNCHDALEEAWNLDDSPGRNLYRGILQVGIAYFQIERGNYRGAIKMLMRVRQWLDPLPEWCRGVNVAQLRENAQEVQSQLSALGPSNISAFDKSIFKPIQYKITPN